MKLIRDKKDNSIFEALDFGGPKIYQVDNTWIYAPEGGISLTKTATDITLEPFGLMINLETSGDGDWSIISHQNPNTCNWRVTVKNNITLEEISGVYPFNLMGNVYQLPCGGNEWVIASCGGYEIESTWVGQSGIDCYRLKGTNEIISTFLDLKWINLHTNPRQVSIGNVTCVSNMIVYMEYMGEVKVFTPNQLTCTKSVYDDDYGAGHYSYNRRPSCLGNDGSGLCGAKAYGDGFFASNCDTSSFEPHKEFYYWNGVQIGERLGYGEWTGGRHSFQVTGSIPTMLGAFNLGPISNSPTYVVTDAYNNATRKANDLACNPDFTNSSLYD